MKTGEYTRTYGFPDTNTVIPRFFIEPVQDFIASDQQGRPIFRDEERVELNMPGNQLSRPVMRVTDEHRNRWPEQYKRFKAGIEMSADGTPLEEWPVLRPSQVKELKMLGFATVEQIADMTEIALQKIPMYGRMLKERAAAYLDDARAASVVEKVTADNARKEAEMAALRLQIENLTQLVQSLHGQVRTAQDAPHPIATAVPYMADPLSRAAQQPAPIEAPGESAFANMAPRRKRRGDDTMPDAAAS